MRKNFGRHHALLVGIGMWIVGPKDSATDPSPRLRKQPRFIPVCDVSHVAGRLSTDRTSLRDAQERLSIIIELIILEFLG